MSVPDMAGTVFEEVKDQVLEKDTNTVGIVVAVLLGILSLLILLIWTRKKTLGRDVLICGPCDAGKTTLLSQLVMGKPVETYTSMVHTNISINLEDKPSINLVDIPGHERIRGSILDQFSSSARAILYVVDSNTVAKQVKDVAEFLHNILSHKAINRNRPPVVVFCNKQDSGLAKTAQAIQTILEKEIEKVRLTSIHQLEGLEGETSNGVFIGKEGKSFEFKDLSHSVTFVEGSATDLDTLGGLSGWLVKIA